MQVCLEIVSSVSTFAFASMKKLDLSRIHLHLQLNQRFTLNSELIFVTTLNFVTQELNLQSKVSNRFELPFKLWDWSIVKSQKNDWPALRLHEAS